MLNGRYIGYCVGARDLTWSYVAFETASYARQRLLTAAARVGLLTSPSSVVDIPQEKMPKERPRLFWKVQSAIMNTLLRGDR